MPDSMTALDVAAQTGLSQSRVLQWAKANGKQKFGRSYIFSPADIDVILATKGKTGRPRKTAVAN